MGVKNGCVRNCKQQTTTYLKDRGAGCRGAPCRTWSRPSHCCKSMCPPRCHWSCGGMFHALCKACLGLHSGTLMPGDKRETKGEGELPPTQPARPLSYLCMCSKCCHVVQGHRMGTQSKFPATARKREAASVNAVCGAKNQHNRATHVHCTLCRVDTHGLLQGAELQRRLPPASIILVVCISVVCACKKVCLSIGFEAHRG